MNYRSELKYILNNNDFNILKHNLKALLKKDSNCLNESYKISSLYFDDYKNTSYNQVVNGISERWKYRIRFYNNDNTYIKLEKKYKRNNRTLKTSTRITYEIFENILKRNVKIGKDKLLNEFIIKINTDLLKPVIFVEYDRIPYVYKIGNVRITLDYNIGYTTRFNNLFGEKRLYYINEKILEVKYNELLPDFIRYKLELNHLEQISFSKFRNCIERSKLC